MQNILKRLLKKAKISYKSFHKLRHTYASRANEYGVDLKTISECMGHSDCAFTMNKYIHVNEEQKAKVITKFDSHKTITNKLITNYIIDNNKLENIFDKNLIRNNFSYNTRLYETIIIA